MKTYSEIMNGGVLYALVILGLLYIAGYCFYSLRRGAKRAMELGVTKDDIMGVIRGSISYAIVPSIAVLIGLFSLSGAIGIPWAWFRLSVLGAVGYELTAADMAATGAGFDGISAVAAANDPSAVGLIMLSMSIGISVGLIYTLILAKPIQNGMVSVNKKSGPLGAVIMACFTMAILTVMVPRRSIFAGNIATVTLLTSAFVTFIMRTIMKKYNVKWLKNFVMAFALLLGMASSILWSALLS